MTGRSQRDAGTGKGILIGDRSALFFHLHRDSSGLNRVPRALDPRAYSVDSVPELVRFNTQHPLFGGEPVSVLVPESRLRMRGKAIDVRLMRSALPSGSVVELRENLLIAGPELTYVRLASGMSETQLAEIGMSLCARYFVDVHTEAICQRSQFLTTPKRLERYCLKAAEIRGSVKARRALRWVLPNSGSPMETKMKLQFCHPLWKGGFALPFTCMNYDVSARRLSDMTDKGWYCLDLVSVEHKVGFEYDGREYHLDTSSDHRRRNALRALGWDVFPVDRGILFDAEATERLGYQAARRMGLRLQKPKSWEEKYIRLRKDLGLPV